MIVFGLIFVILFSFNISSNKSKIIHVHTHSCPEYFVPLQNRCYHFGTQAVTWFQAFQQCSLLGATLLSLETEPEMQKVYKYIKKLYPTHKKILNPDNKTLAITAAFWTSGTDLTGKNKWIWLGSGIPIFNTDWCPGQPDNKNGVEHCIKLLASSDKHCWNDRNCFSRDTATNGTQTFYICEFNRPHLYVNADPPKENLTII